MRFWHIDRKRRHDQHGWTWPSFDNICLKRRWRMVKYEEDYLKQHDSACYWD